MKLSIAKLKAIRLGIFQILDLETPTIVLERDADGREKVEQRKNPLKLSTMASYGLRKNLRLLDAVLEPAEEQRKALVKHWSNDGKIDLNQEFVVDPADPSKRIPNSARAGFSKEYQALLDEVKEDFDPFKISEKEFEKVPAMFLYSIDALLAEPNP